MTKLPVNVNKDVTKNVPARSVMAFCLAGLFAATLVSCSPEVKVSAPDKPITINLNVKIEHEIRVKVEKDLDQIFSEDSELF